MLWNAHCSMPSMEPCWGTNKREEQKNISRLARRRRTGDIIWSTCAWCHWQQPSSLFYFLRCQVTASFKSHLLYRLWTERHSLLPGRSPVHLYGGRVHKWRNSAHVCLEPQGWAGGTRYKISVKHTYKCYLFLLVGCKCGTPVNLWIQVPFLQSCTRSRSRTSRWTSLWQLQEVARSKIIHSTRHTVHPAIGVQLQPFSNH